MNSNIILIVLLFFVFVLNFGHSYKSIENYLYQETYSNVIDEFLEIFKQNEVRQPPGLEAKKIGDVLSIQPGIENSYIMTTSVIVGQYSHGKILFATFQEGVRNDTLENYITRKNWSDFDLFISNHDSHPSNMMNTRKPIPDYLVYEYSPYLLPMIQNNTQYEDLKFLSDPTNPKIPSNFELLYKSNKTGTVVYKIHHEK
jgi:hypothetical protein